MKQGWVLIWDIFAIEYGKEGKKLSDGTDINTYWVNRNISVPVVCLFFRLWQVSLPSWILQAFQAASWPNLLSPTWSLQIEEKNFLNHSEKLKFISKMNNSHLKSDIFWVDCVKCFEHFKRSDYFDGNPPPCDMWHNLKNVPLVCHKEASPLDC